MKAIRVLALVNKSQVKVGDHLLLNDGKTIMQAQAKIVKVSDYDGTEVIFDVKNNKYFNVGMYLEGKSWVKEVLIVTLEGEA